MPSPAGRRPNDLSLENVSVRCRSERARRATSASRIVVQLYDMDKGKGAVRESQNLAYLSSGFYPIHCVVWR